MWREMVLANGRGGMERQRMLILKPHLLPRLEDTEESVQHLSIKSSI
jgi:hypothetical protein